MKLQAIVSSVALAAALTFSGAAVAQNMLNGMEIPTDQIQTFQDRCAALRAESTASLSPADAGDDADGTDDTETGSIGGEPKIGNDDPASENNWAAALASLTLEECEAASFGAM